jgi:EAL domain-containing protein (putative c-di-GMP-specific phosphodiesterase class I)
VNGQRITEPLKLGPEDLVHFAEAPFRVRKQSAQSTAAGTIAENVCDQALALVQFDRLMSQRLVVPHFQPIVNMEDTKPIGFEILGRGRVFGLESIKAMFEAAAQLNLEVELSQMLRWEGVRVGRELANEPVLYVNTHPSELKNSKLRDSLLQLRKMAGSTPLVLEIHEAALTDSSQLCELQKLLNQLGILLAFDDFGSGQARLRELAEAKPHVVKFDMSLIRGIDRAGPQRQQVVETLVKMIHDLDIQALAEGIETEEEATVCRQLKFDLAQGYLFGRPAPFDAHVK